MVVSTKTKPTSPTPITCKLDSTCQLFNWGGKEEIKPEQLSTIRSGNPYLLNIDQDSLTHNTVIAIDNSSSNQLWFVVRATTKKTDTGSLESIPPRSLITREELRKQYKTALFSDNPDTTVIKSKRYYNNLEQTYIERGSVNHDGFLVFEWGKEADKVPFFTDTTDNTKVDKYIFKSIDVQKKELLDGPQLTLQITGSRILEDNNSLVEIYEIKNQDVVKQAMEKASTSSITPDNWESMAKDSMMVTKLSQLEKGKYYKFVIDNFSAIETQLKNGFEKLKIGFYTINKSDFFNLFERDVETNPGYCIKFTTQSKLSCKCTAKKAS